MMGMGLGLPRGFNFVAAAQQMIKRADYGDGASVAFSLVYVSQSYSGDVLLTRRSSDNAQLGVTPSQITDGTLLSFCNTEVTKYTSDFSVSENLGEDNGTGAAAQSVGGVNDAYKFTLTGGNVVHQTRVFNSTDIGNQFRLEFDYYIPSTNATVNRIRITQGISGHPDLTTLDAWTSSTFTGTGNGTLIRFAASTDGGVVIIDADGDVFYLKNIVVTQLTSDGHVVTWYDQRNGNDATQGTATRQPKIVEAGVLVTENGKPAIRGGNTTRLQAAFALQTPMTIFSVSTKDVVNADQMVYDGYDGVNYLYWQSTTKLVAVVAGDVLDAIIGEYSDQKLIVVKQVSGGSNVRVDGVQTDSDTTTGTRTANGITILDIRGAGAPVAANFNWLGTVQEIIVYPDDQSANTPLIEDQINQHYTIY